MLVTGSIWARASWGHWWVWDEPMLVSFLIVFLLYATYQPLRFSIEDPERQARYASVFAIVAGAFVPLNFAAVRMAEHVRAPADARHDDGRDARRDDADVPRRAGRDGAAVRHAVQVRDGVQARDASRLRALRRRLAGDDDALALAGRSAAPQLLMLPPCRSTAASYVAAAYLVFLALHPDLRRDHGRRS